MRSLLPIMASCHAEEGSPKAELPTLEDVQHRDRPGTMKSLLMIVFALDAASLYLYPRTIILASSKNDVPINKEYGHQQWPVAKVAESNMPALAPAFGSYDP